MLKMQGISKSFPGVKALDNVSFSVAKGTIHGLVGENGAGKSTLMKILSGAYSCDEGHVTVDGEEIKNSSPALMLEKGVAVIYQELMLRITSEDERLVQDPEIRWFKRTRLMEAMGNFNFYITTDFATSNKQTADYSVISVWAYNANGDWFWVDGVCERQTMDKSINDLFRLVTQYRPQQVGVEVTGQQGAFISWLQQEMLTRNIWFNFASSEKSGAPGIRPLTDKLSRFNIVVPWFKAGKMYFPNEMKKTTILGMFMAQLRLATASRASRDVRRGQW